MARIYSGLSSRTFITGKGLFYIAFAVVMVICAHLLLIPWPYSLIPFGLIFATVFIVAVLRYPMIGLHVYLFFFLVRPQELFPDVALMHQPYEKVVAIIVIISLVFTYLIKRRDFELFDIDKGVLAMVIAMGLSVLPAVWVGGAKDEFITVFKIIIACFFTARIANTERKFKSIVWLYILSVGFVAVSSMYQYYMGHYEYAMGVRRALGVAGQQGLYSDPNSMASSLVLGMPFIFYTMKSYKSFFVRAILVSIMLICLWTVIISGSRGGMLGSIIMLSLIGMISRHKVLALIVVIFTVVGAAAVMPDQYVQRFQSIVKYDELDDGTGAAESAQGRIKGLKVGLEILLRRPLTLSLIHI